MPQFNDIETAINQIADQVDREIAQTAIMADEVLKRIDALTALANRNGFMTHQQRIALEDAKKSFATGSSKLNSAVVVDASVKLAA